MDILRLKNVFLSKTDFEKLVFARILPADFQKNGRNILKKYGKNRLNPSVQLGAGPFCLQTR